MFIPVTINTKINDHFSSCTPVFLFEISGDSGCAFLLAAVFLVHSVLPDFLSTLCLSGQCSSVSFFLLREKAFSYYHNARY